MLTFAHYRFKQYLKAVTVTQLLIWMDEHEHFLAIAKMLFGV